MLVPEERKSAKHLYEDYPAESGPNTKSSHQIEKKVCKIPQEIKRTKHSYEGHPTGFVLRVDQLLSSKNLNLNHLWESQNLRRTKSLNFPCMKPIA
jgi:hypothetical protein